MSSRASRVPVTPRLAMLTVAIAAIALLPACGSVYKETGERFATGYDEASKIISANLNAQLKARRLLAVRRYIDHGLEGNNFTKNPAESFARYACAAEGDFFDQRAGLSVLATYKKIIAKIAETPDEGVGALWRSIEENRKARAPLKPPAEDPAARADCVQLVQKLLMQGGIPMADPDLESITALTVAYDGLKTLAESVEKVFVGGLKIFDEAVRARALRDFVKTNKDLIGQILASSVADNALTPAYERRLRAALVAPFEEFKSIYRYNRATESDKIVQASSRAHESLSEFDTLRLEAAPSEVAKAMKEAQKQLVDLADGNIDVKQAWAALGALAQMLKDLNEAVENAKKQKKD